MIGTWNGKAGKPTQTWEVGEIVKVGFLKLRVLAKIPTPGDYMPDAYALGSATGSIYRFVPHNGLTKCANIEEAING
jgi:hypothetical protein